MSDKLPPKPQLLKEWHERKGNEPWTLEEIAELIAYASWLGEQATEERIIKMLEEHMPNSSDHDFVGCECEYPTNNWYNNHLAALIKGEK